MISECTFTMTEYLAPGVVLRVCPAPAARLRVDVVGLGEATVTEPALCFRHLNRWLDEADEGRMPEPLALTFVDPCPLGWAWWSVDLDAPGSRTAFGPSVPSCRGRDCGRSGCPSCGAMASYCERRDA